MQFYSPGEASVASVAVRENGPAQQSVNKLILNSDDAVNLKLDQLKVEMVARFDELNEKIENLESLIKQRH